ncbi:glycerol-3-phosphate dehydrogenase [candidate division WOR-3 bacterium]|uniref:Glycerol-3-phosphate dehydrogenase [NAD(P)+] n=1 Tax=candidate division WOR-3 bacterium TaxID=2052148 RepID=A0A660SHB6_UNCW3|nr:MAG: glycerol-3-phosphate dehydrogenase [candidate division WOR-3 bacterium]
MRLGILGAGNWGSVFALMESGIGHEASLWEYDEERAVRVARTRDNRPFLNERLPDFIRITSDIDRVMAEADLIVLALPSQSVRSLVARIRSDRPILSLTKGIDLDTKQRISQLLEARIPKERIAVLSGPSIANEVLNHHPTSVVLASENQNLARWLQEELATPYFRIYTTSDLTGVELCGAYKNTIAIACGLSDGLGFGTNAKAALISRGLVEMRRFVTSWGGDPRTVFGLAGLGDVITTSFSPHSRNRWLGEEIGRGRDPKDVIEKMVMVAEGYYSTPAIVEMGRTTGVELPIAQGVNAILHHGVNPKDVVEEIMSRPLKREEE